MHLLHSYLLGIGRQWFDFPTEILPFSRLSKHDSFSCEVLQPLNPADPFWTISRLSTSLLNWGEKNWIVCSKCGLTGAEQRRKNTSLHLPAIVLLIQPRMLLAFIAARIHGWLMFSLLSAKTPRAFSAEQLSSQPVPSWCYCLGLFHPRFRTWHLSLLNLMLNLILVGRISTACWDLSIWWLFLPAHLPPLPA